MTQVARSSLRITRSVCSQVTSSFTHRTASVSAPVADGRCKERELLAGLIRGPDVFLVSRFLVGGVGGTYPPDDVVDDDMRIPAPLDAPPTIKPPPPAPPPPAIPIDALFAIIALIGFSFANNLLATLPATTTLSPIWNAWSLDAAVPALPLTLPVLVTPPVVGSRVPISWETKRL